MNRILTTAGALALVSTPAAAADFAPFADALVDMAVSFAVPVAIGGALWLGRKVAKVADRYGVKVSQEAMNAAAVRLEAAMERKLRAEIKSRVPETIDLKVQHEIAGRMLDYAATQLPDTIKTMGMTPENVRRMATEMVADWTTPKR